LPWRAVAAYLLAVVLYPGALTVLLLGGIAEEASRRLLRFAPQGMFALLHPRRLRERRAVPAEALAAGVMAVVAASQVAAPYSPIPAAERNLLVAAFALLGGGWILDLLRRESPSPATLLVGQAGWLVAVFLPAVISQNLRPQALGSLVITTLLPMKVASGILYLLCLPVLLRLLPETGELQPAAALARVAFWVPFCGLFVSIFVPPAPADAVGLAVFLLLTVTVAAVTMASALLLRRDDFARVIYLRAIPPFAGLTLGIAAVTALLRQP
jgi:hypothetical protein